MVSYFIKNDKTLNGEKIKSCLPNYIVNNIFNIPIPMNDISNKLIWNSFDGKFLKQLLGQNNDQMQKFWVLFRS